MFVPPPPALLVAQVDADPRNWAARSLIADWYHDRGDYGLYEAWCWLNDEGRVPAAEVRELALGGGWYSLVRPPQLWETPPPSSQLPDSLLSAPSADDGAQLITFSGTRPYAHLRRAAEVIARDRLALPRGMPR